MQTLPTAFLALCLAGAATLARAEDSAEKWMPLFDGKTLDGWSNPYEWGEAKAVDGEIHLKAQKKFFLVSDEKVKDFIFEGEILLPEGQANSGFMFRAHVEKNKVFGYQAEVDGSDRKWSGGLYDEGRRGWLHPFRADGKASDADKKRAKETQEAFKEVGTAFKRSDWNKYRIECRGNRLQIWVNGVQTTDYTDDTDAEGSLAIQHHGEKDQVYRFRNLRLQHLPAGAKGEKGEKGDAGWETLLGDDGDLSAWNNPGDGWKVEGGVLTRAGKAGDLLTKKSYADFELTFEWKIAAGANSGVKYRFGDYGGKQIGPEYQLLDDAKWKYTADSKNSTASLYDVIPPAADKKTMPVGEWNASRIVAKGSAIEHFLNGELAMKTDLSGDEFKAALAKSKFKGQPDFATKAGHIMLQDHGGEVSFRHIKIRPQ